MANFVPVKGKMNIVIDIGNSSAKVGVFTENELITTKRFVAIPELVDYVNKSSPSALIISCVGERKPEINSLIETFSGCILLDHQTSVPITMKYESPQTLGVDRIAAVIGARNRFRETNCLVIDMGTALTYDFIDAEGCYWGGGITAGAKMKLMALHNYTASLPLVELGEEDWEIVGSTTERSILSGVVNGTTLEIDGMIEKYMEKFGDLKVILTGGEGVFFERRIKAPIFVAPNIVLEGLNAILRYNVEDR